MGFDIKRALKFEKNVGEKDQKMRYLAGSISLGIAVFTGSIALLLIGIILIATGYSTWCPIMSGLGRTSCGN